MKCLVSKNVKNVVAVGVHQKKNVMFWADEYLGKIFSSVLGRNDTPAEVVAIDSKIKDLAIDWITEKLYWLTTPKGNFGSCIYTQNRILKVDFNDACFCSCILITYFVCFS